MTLTLANARLIDPETGTDAPGTVTISDGMIAEILPASTKAAPGTQMIDLAGKCLAPGIVDIGVKAI